MECARVKELLSEYLDNALDAQTKALVEGHLSTCKVCSEELASLKAYIEQFGTLKAVKAPEDFLEKVHARLKRRFEFERIMRKVFVPVRIKVPLQLVAVAAMLFLVISVFKFIQPPAEKLTYVPSVSKQVTVAERHVEEPIELAKKPIEEPIKLARKEEKPIELALLIKPEVPAMLYEERMVRKEEADYSKTAREDIKEGEQITGALRSAEGAPRSADIIRRDKKALPPPYSEEILFRVKELIELAEGKVTSVEYEKETSRPQFVNVEIPFKNYSALLERLTQLGQLQKPLPTLALEDEQIIQIQIKLLE